MLELPNLIGGTLSLDFVNTVDPRHAPDRREYLDSYSALATWGGHAGAVAADQAERLRAAAAGDPAGAERVLNRAIRLREALYPLFRAAAQEQPPGSEDLDVLQAELTRALSCLRITWTPAGYVKNWEQPGAPLDQVLWPVSRSAAELLTHGPLDRIRERAAGCPSTSARTPAAAGATCGYAATGPRPAAITRGYRPGSGPGQDARFRRAPGGRRGSPGWLRPGRGLGR